MGADSVDKLFRDHSAVLRNRVNEAVTCLKDWMQLGPVWLRVEVRK